MMTMTCNHCGASCTEPNAGIAEILAWDKRHAEVCPKKPAE